MNETNLKIKPSLLMFLVIGFGLGSTLLLSLIDTFMKQNIFIVVISGFLLSIPFILTYITLAKKFPGRNLIEINDIVYGNILGKIISIIYILFFILLFAYNTEQLVGFYSTYIMSETPPAILYVMFGLICAYAVKKGVASIAKLSIYTVAFAIFSVLFTFLLLLGNMDFANVLPIGEVSIKEFVRGTYMMACIPYCELIILLMVMPFVDKHHKAGKYAMMGVIIVVLIYLLITMRVISTLGSSGAIYTESSFQSVRNIDIGEFLTRMELFVALGLLASIFIKTSILNYVSVKSIAQLLKLKSYVPLLLPLVGIIAVLAMISFDSNIHFIHNANYHIVYALPLEFILPPLTLLIAKIRKLPNKGGVTL